MRDTILSLPQQLTDGIALGTAQRLDKPYRSMVSCGMGGSAIAGEMLSMIKDNVIVHWDYDLPVHVGAQDLIICTSWSGNTEETISSYEKAIALGIDTLVITTGGKLSELARQHNSPLIILPADSLQPRTAEGYMVGALFAALGLADMLPKALDPAALEKTGQELAKQIGNRLL